MNSVPPGSDSPAPRPSLPAESICHGHMAPPPGPDPAPPVTHDPHPPAAPTPGAAALDDGADPPAGPGPAAGERGSAEGEVPSAGTGGPGNDPVLPGGPATRAASGEPAPAAGASPPATDTHGEPGDGAWAVGRGTRPAAVGGPFADGADSAAAGGEVSERRGDGFGVLSGTGAPAGPAGGGRGSSPSVLGGVGVAPGADPGGGPGARAGGRLSGDGGRPDRRGADQAAAGMARREPGAAGLGGPSVGGAGAVAAGRGVGDPLRGVAQRHQAMIAGSVDVWEIAAGLEARGVTDADARRLRHRDVFGLAEELRARVPRSIPRHAPAVPTSGREPVRLPARSAALHLLPGAGCALAVATARPVHLPLLGALLAVLAAAATWAALRQGPLRAAGHETGAGWSYGLLGFALYGPQAGAALAGDGPFDPAASTGAFTALALSLLPAAYCARWFAVGARAQLAPSHGLSDFADAVRPRLAAALAGYAAALLALLAATGAVVGDEPVAGPTALGLLLFTARLLAVHGRGRTAAGGLAAACAAEALYLAAALAGLALDGATAEAAICGCAALALTTRAFRVLPRASAHRRT